MNKYVILTDNCVDMTPAQRKEYGIEYPIPGFVTFPNGESKLADIDWEQMTFEEFFHSMEKKAIYKSAMPNPFQVAERVEEYFKQGKDVLVVTLSGGMSGTYNSFLSVKQELAETYPSRSLYIVDSRRYSGGISLLCIYASINRANGMSIEENFKWLEEKKLCLHQVGILDNLFFLHRSGRISKTKAFFGTMAGVKPMADFSNETGMPCVLGNARGYKASYKISEEFMSALIGKQEPQYIIVVNSIREEQAKEFVALSQRVAPNAKVLSCHMGQSNGVNVGPGLVVAFFLGEKPVSKDCEEERKLLTSILAKK